MTTIKDTIAFLIVIFLNFYILTAQATSTEHRVVKGDNVYRLSLRYGVSMESIFQLNPDSRTMIKLGEILLIPKNEDLTTVDNAEGEATFKNYLVSKGETKYGLSKKFNVSIKALEEANPSIVKMLLANQTIRVPSRSDKDSVVTNTETEAITHIVKKGENLWRISQQYNLTLSELKALNKDKLTEFLEIGQELTVRRNLNTHDSYLVAKGDTKYGLAKQFNMSISELEELNPEIVPMLKYGARIKTRLIELKENEVTNIVENDSETEDHLTKENLTSNTDSLQANPKYTLENYTIKAKETLYGLAKKANMSIEEFLELNPSLKTSVTKGSIIKMPIENATTKSAVSSIVNANSDISSISNNKNTIAISIVWDDTKTSENAEIKEQKRDYYIGLQKAVDSMRKRYPNNNLRIEDGLANQVDSKDSSLNPEIPNIVLNPLVQYKETNNSSSDIDVMSLKYNYQGEKKEFRLRGLPTEEDMRREVLTYLNKQSGNVICIYDKNHVQNKNLIENSLTKVAFIPTKKNGTFDSDELNDALQLDVKNFVIIESDKVGAFLSSTNILLKRLSKTNIQLVVLDPKNIPSDGAVAGKRFKILQLLYPQLNNPDISKGSSKTTALGFAFSYDILERLQKSGIESFNSNTTTSVFGFAFNYTLEEGIYKNKAVKLFVFDENSSGIEINKY